MKAREPPVLPAAAAIAVLPFEAPTGDTALARLGKDLAVTVSASLDGVGGVTTTDRLSIAGATEGKQNLSITEVRQAGSRARRPQHPAGHSRRHGRDRSPRSQPV